MRAFTSCFTFSPILPEKQNPEGEQATALDTLASFSQISRVWDCVSCSGQDACEFILIQREIGGGQGSFGIGGAHSQIKHNCLEKNDPEVNATSVASGRDSELRRLQTLIQGFSQRPSGSVIFGGDSPKPALLEVSQIPLDSNDHRAEENTCFYTLSTYISKILTTP